MNVEDLGRRIECINVEDLDRLRESARTLSRTTMYSREFIWNVQKSLIRDDHTIDQVLEEIEGRLWLLAMGGVAAQ